MRSERTGHAMQTRRLRQRGSDAERIAKEQAKKAQKADAALRAAIAYTAAGRAAAAQRNGLGGHAARCYS